jgi:hypothetical protein
MQSLKQVWSRCHQFSVLIPRFAIRIDRRDLVSLCIYNQAALATSRFITQQRPRSRRVNNRLYRSTHYDLSLWLICLFVPGKPERSLNNPDRYDCPLLRFVRRFFGSPEPDAADLFR